MGLFLIYFAQSMMILFCSWFSVLWILAYRKNCITPGKKVAIAYLSGDHEATLANFFQRIVEQPEASAVLSVTSDL